MAYVLKCPSESQGAAAATPPPRAQPADSCRELAVLHPVVHRTTSYCAFTQPLKRLDGPSCYMECIHYSEHTEACFQ